MSILADLAFFVAIFVGPLLAVAMCVLMRPARQPRWVVATTYGLTAVSALAWVGYWYVWGVAFEYADTDRPVPVGVERQSAVTVLVCLVTTVMLAALGASRLASSRNGQGRSLAAPSSPET